MGKLTVVTSIATILGTIATIGIGFWTAVTPTPVLSDGAKFENNAENSGVIVNGSEGVTINIVSPEGELRSELDSSTNSNSSSQVAHRIEELPVFDVKASSTRKSGNISYSPRAVSNDITRSSYNSSWYSGRGEIERSWVELFIPKPMAVSEIGFYLDFASERGSQIRDARIVFNDGSAQDISFEYQSEWQYVELPEPIITAYVRVEVESVWPDTKGDYLEVREIKLFGWSEI